MQAETGIEFPLVEAPGESVPLPDASFDLALSEYGASLWADPERWVAGGGAAAASRRPARVPHELGARVPLRARRRAPSREQLQRPQFGMRRIQWPGEAAASSSTCRTASGSGCCARNGFEVEALHELRPREDAVDAGLLRLRHRRLGAQVARRGDLGGAEGVSAPPAPPLLLASTSPQRRAILEQLHIPFDVAAPSYVEHDPPDADPVELVRRHALGKAQVGRSGRGRPPGARRRHDGRARRPDLREARRCGRRGADARGAVGPDARRRLGARARDAGLGARRATSRRSSPSVRSPRATSPRYVASGEWEGRAGGYAIQGRGAALVERVEGDYLNVVGLPASALVRLLAGRFAGVYGFG